ncbi:MAG: 1-acyl-sn-glycerol-3-phosphate acyltransferase [Planctomycetota bacterium]
MHWIRLSLVLLIGVVALAGLVASRSRANQVGWPAWVCYQIAVLHQLLFSRCRQNNRCTIPENGPAIIVANHTSPADPVLLWTRHFAEFQKPHLRVIGYLTAREYYEKHALITWVCRAMECIPVDRNGRDMQPLRLALRRLSEGRLLGLFPEGRLNATSPNNQLLPGDTGAAWLALKANVPVIPVFIHHAPRHPSMLLAFFVRTKASLTYGTPIDLSPWQGRKLSADELAEATDHIMKTLATLGQVQYTPLPRTTPELITPPAPQA